MSHTVRGLAFCSRKKRRNSSGLFFCHGPAIAPICDRSSGDWGVRQAHLVKSRLELLTGSVTKFLFEAIAIYGVIASTTIPFSVFYTGTVRALFSPALRSYFPDKGATGLARENVMASVGRFAGKNRRKKIDSQKTLMASSFGSGGFVFLFASIFFNSRFRLP